MSDQPKAIDILDALKQLEERGAIRQPDGLYRLRVPKENLPIAITLHCARVLALQIEIDGEWRDITDAEALALACVSS